ncbi:MAG: glycosyltransferase [Candidatus Eremiobacteraeota bacterium]|nr:glycosyltransferase [Candidatus Eremiobacteraeota bacterium]
MVTGDMRRWFAKKSISLVKRHTDACELIIMDNGRSPDFNHAREMNRALEMTSSDFLVLMDDDVFVGEGWLEGLIASLDSDTAVVSPSHIDRYGVFTHSGIYLLGDGLGTHAHFTDTPAEPRECQCLCSALLLIDMRKIRHLRFSPSYRKYYHDLCHSLQVWEAGFKVRCTPHVAVTHLGGATIQELPSKLPLLWNTDRETFVEEWVASGRLGTLEEGIWAGSPFISPLGAVVRRIRNLPSLYASQEALEKEVDSLALDKYFPLFKSFLVSTLRQGCLQEHSPLSRSFVDSVQRRLMSLVSSPGCPRGGYLSGCLPVERESRGSYRIVEYKGHFTAFPFTFTAGDMVKDEALLLPDIVEKKSMEDIDKVLKREKNGTAAAGNSRESLWLLLRAAAMAAASLAPSLWTVFSEPVPLYQSLSFWGRLRGALWVLAVKLRKLAARGRLLFNYHRWALALKPEPLPEEPAAR